MQMQVTWRKLGNNDSTLAKLEHNQVNQPASTFEDTEQLFHHKETYFDVV